MHNSESYLAYTPRGAGLLCALAYVVRGEDVYGWYVGAKGSDYPAAFFMLERFYSTRATAFRHTLENDVYGTWVEAFPPLQQVLDRPVPVPEALCHELSEMQSAFSSHWLFYGDDPQAGAEIAAYREAELPVAAVNVRLRRMNKFDRGDAVWTYASARLDGNVIDYLKDNWPLDFAAADRPAEAMDRAAKEKEWKQK